MTSAQPGQIATKRLIDAALRNAKLRASKRGIPFALTREYLASIMTPNCPVLGTPLKVYSGCGRGPRDSSPSLDCIVRERGYVAGNVVWVSHRANRAKSDLALSELFALADFYRNRP